MCNVSWYSTRLKKKERGGSLQNVKGLSINQRQGDESEKRRWLVLKRPRGDTNGVGEDDVTVYHTVTSGQHAQAERAKKTEEFNKEEGELHGHIRCRFRKRSRAG